MKHSKKHQLVTAVGSAFVWMAAGFASTEPARAVPSMDLGWGPTHVTWESEAVAAFLSFGDYAVESRRTADGTVSTLVDSDLRPVARLVEEKGDGRLMHLEIRTDLKKRKRAKRTRWVPVASLALQEEQPRPLAWSALQLFSLWEDRSFVREMKQTARKKRRGLRTQRRGPLEHRLPLVEAQWRDGLLRAVSAEREQPTANGFLGQVRASALVYGDMFASSKRTESGFQTALWKRSPGDDEFTTDEPKGHPLGLLAWDPVTQRMSFSFGDQVHAGVWADLDASVLPGGYFPFTPSMAWAEIQIRQSWFQYRSSRARAARQTKAASLPTVNALPNTNLDDIGCDGLAWFDNSSLRQCCDKHDNCYYGHVVYTGAGCTANSWFWPFCGQTVGCNWSCQKCNIAVVGCFPLNLRLNPFCNSCWYIDFMWGNPGNYCHLDFPGACPVECIGCTW